MTYYKDPVYAMSSKDKFQAYIKNQQELIQSTLDNLKDWRENDLPVFVDCVNQPLRDHDIVLMINTDYPGLASISFDAREIFINLQKRLNSLTVATSWSHVPVDPLEIYLKMRYLDPTHPEYTTDDPHPYDIISIEEFHIMYDNYKNSKIPDRDLDFMCNNVFRVPQNSDHCNDLLESIMINKLSKSHQDYDED